MKLLIDKEYDYTPEWNGNKEDDSPIVFHMRAITDSERERFITKKYIDGHVEMATNETQIFKAGVTSIENLNINNKDIKTATDFIACPGLSGLFSEVVAEILLNTVRKDLKN
jgi:hypothetical protein